MTIWYAAFSLIALPGILTVFLPSDNTVLEDEEAAPANLPPVRKPVAIPQGRMPLHDMQPMPMYRVFFRTPAHRFF